MSYEITSESYGRRLPKITATATSTDDLATLGTDWAEGSTCTISDTTYKLDKVKGWVDPSSAPSGGGGAHKIPATWSNGSVTLGNISVDDYIEICSEIAENGTPCFFAIDYGGGHVLNVALTTAYDHSLCFQKNMESGSAAGAASIVTYEVYESDGSMGLTVTNWEFTASH